MIVQSKLTPSFSLSISTFFIATNFLFVFLSLALNTSLWKEQIHIGKLAKSDAYKEYNDYMLINREIDSCVTESNGSYTP